MNKMNKFCSSFILCVDLQFSVLSFQQKDAIIIKNITVINVGRQPVEELKTIIIKGSKIHSILDESNIENEDTNLVIDGSGKYLIPGLWDMHVHIVKAEKTSLPLFPINGVTTVRDMGSDFYLNTSNQI